MRAIFASEALIFGIHIMSELKLSLNVLEIRDGKLKWIVLAAIQCRQANAMQRGKCYFKPQLNVATSSFPMEKTGVEIGKNLYN